MKRRASTSVSQGGAITIRNPLFVKKTGYKKRFSRWSGPEQELKFFDTALSFTVDATAEIPATGQLTLIPQDDTQSGRDGNKAFIKSINIHGTANMIPASAATASDVFYLYLIQDTQCNGAAATVADANTGIFTSATLANAQRVVCNGSRFRVLKKWVIEFNSTAGVTTAYNNYIKEWSFYKKCNIPILYDASATTGAIGTIRSNNLFLVAGTAGASDDVITVQGSCRFRFSDRS